MTSKSLLLVGAFGILSLGIANAKAYDLIFSNPTKAGSTELKPGKYSLKVEGSEAVFRDVQTSKTWKAPVKVENAGKKYNETIVQSHSEGSMDSIQAIQLGGSTTKIEFGQ